MADTVTPIYQFVSPEIGQSEDSWGGKLNADLAKLEALLVSGFASGSPTDIGRLKSDHGPTSIVLTDANGLQITNAAPQLQFNESDQPMPAGRYRFSGGGDVLTLQRNTHATTPFSTVETAIAIRGNTSSKSIDIPNYRLIVGAALAVSNEANITAYGVGNHYRIKDANNATGKGVVIRTDTSSFYILLTDDGDADGPYNSMRPLYINKTTGRVGHQQGVDISSGGLKLGSNVASAVDDLSAHIDLYGGNYGFNVQASVLNYNANTGAVHTFYAGGVIQGRIDPVGAATVSANTIMTRQKGDARYAMLATANEFAATQSISSDGTVGFKINNAASTTERANMFVSGTGFVIRNQNNTGTTLCQAIFEADGDFNLNVGQYQGDGSALVLSATNVGAASAGLSYNSLGSISIMRSSVAFSRGDNQAASTLTYSNASGNGSVVAASGTWKAHGESTGSGNSERTTNWRRIV